MGKSSPSQPAPVDQSALIDKQAEVNRISQFTPGGDLRFGTLGDQGQFVPNTSGDATFVDLSPENQYLLQLAQATAGELGERGLIQAGTLPGEPLNFSGLPAFGSELDLSSLPGMPGGIDFGSFAGVPEGLDTSGLTEIPGIGDFAAEGNRVRDSQFQQALGLLNPEFDRQQGRLEQQLANRGLPAGGEAFDDEFGRFEDSRNRALQSAAFDPAEYPILAHHWFGVGAATATRRHRRIEHIHQLGPRAIEELVVEVANGEDLDHALDAYQRLTPEMLEATGGDRFPPMLLHEVRRAS